MSRVRQVFRDPQGRLRSLWAALLFVLIGEGALQILTWIALAAGLRFPGPGDDWWSFFVWLQLLQLAAFLFATVAMARWMDHEPVSRSGFRPVRGGAGGVALSIVLAALIPATAIAGAAVGGEVALVAGPLPRPVVAAALGLPGFSEEVFARGYLFYALSRGFLRVPGAVAVTSVLFGALHAFNPGFTPIALTNLILAGLFLASVLLYFDSIWAAIAAHAAFNLSEGILLGLPVSGLSPEGGVFNLELSGPTWLTGGDFGPEGSLPVLLALVGVSFALLRGRARRDAFAADQARTQ